MCAATAGTSATIAKTVPRHRTSGRIAATCARMFGTGDRTCEMCDGTAAMCGVTGGTCGRIGSRGIVRSSPERNQWRQREGSGTTFLTPIAFRLATSNARPRPSPSRSMATRQDVVAEIERLFTSTDRMTALKTVNLFTGAPGEREGVQLEILGQSGGNVEKLRTLVDTAKRNPRASRPPPPPSPSPSPSAPARASSAVSDAADPRLAQATAIAQLQSAHHVK